MTRRRAAPPRESRAVDKWSSRQDGERAPRDQSPNGILGSVSRELPAAADGEEMAAVGVLA
jgi:hypothetical protein